MHIRWDPPDLFELNSAHLVEWYGLVLRQLHPESGTAPYQSSIVLHYAGCRYTVLTLRAPLLFVSVLSLNLCDSGGDLESVHMTCISKACLPWIRGHHTDRIFTSSGSFPYSCVALYEISVDSMSKLRLTPGGPKPFGYLRLHFSWIKSLHSLEFYVLMSTLFYLFLLIHYLLLI